MRKLTLESILDASHLSVQPEGEEFTIGDPVKNIFIRIPEEGAEVVRCMNGERTIQEVQDKLLHEFGFEVDVLDFADSLLDLNLIAKWDGEILTEEAAHENQMAQKLGMIFFGKPTLMVYGVLAAAAIVIGLASRLSFPIYQDAFVFESIGKSLLYFFLVSWVLTIIHEACHYIAASKEGVPVKFNLSIRWFWVVVEADMNGLWSLPKKNRYIPLLAGMIMDAVILSGVIIISERASGNEFLFGTCKMIMLIQTYKLLWQFLIFVRTDVYYVIVTRLNAADLTGDALSFLLRPVSKKHKENYEHLSSSEKNFAKNYGWMYVMGLVIAIFIYCMYTIPGAVFAFKEAMGQILIYKFNSVGFWDGMIPILIALFEAVLWGIGAYQTYARRRNTHVELQNH
ncbi:hypothetical protein [Falsibacillus pallidus]|uniref:hypothetical protein n=1 Tax=Falsibacillus pallidus TaxID=493781 RepID=UPI003D982930